MEAGKSAPTGCYKCGRPGHWSRDCPDSNADPKSNLGDRVPNSSSRPLPSSRPGYSANPKPTAEKPKKVPLSRPKLTPDLLLGDDGLGYILRHFPRNFRYRGRGHEVDDLGNLIGLYREWHSQLLPYYSFDQFVHKVEQVAGSKRVKMCINDLREKISGRENPTNWHKSPSENVSPDVEKDSEEAMNSEGLQHQENQCLNNCDADIEQEDMLHEVYEKSIQESAKTSNFDVQPQNKDRGAICSQEVITPEQKARIEANRLKALERAAALTQKN